MANNETQETKGFYKLSWLQRIGFGSGDLAQNLIFQVICTYLLFFYTDIYGLTPSAVAVMFLVGNVATGYMWALVPEVISYGEYTTGRRISGIVNALTGLFFKAGMTFGSIVGPAVLAYVGYNSDSIDQTPFAQEGILWLVCVIPAILLALAMFIISRYELTDEVIDKINMEIEKRNR